MKFCKDCAHYKPLFFYGKCAIDAQCSGAPVIESGLDLVTGEMTYKYQFPEGPRTNRRLETHCGKEARWFKSVE